MGKFLNIENRYKGGVEERELKFCKAKQIFILVILQFTALFTLLRQ